jgi:hypothetical protein
MLAGCTYPASGTEPTPVPTTGTAKLITAALQKVRVVPARPKVAGYKRDDFGQTWSDDHAGPGGHNGCDTRNDMLASQLTGVHYRAKSKCVVIAGVLPADPYTGRRIEFRKADAAKLQIDHIYPLARAWDLGASTWPQQRRVDFANDETANLIVVDGSSNASKSDQGPGEWLPLNRTYRCTYVLRYLQVAAKYALPVTTADRTAATTITRTCP